MNHSMPPPPTPGVDPNSCPSSWWCHPAISSSVVPSSSCPQSLPASGSFPMSQLFAWGGFSFSISPSNEHPGLISFRQIWAQEERYENWRCQDAEPLYWQKVRCSGIIGREETERTKDRESTQLIQGDERASGPKDALIVKKKILTQF